MSTLILSLKKKIESLDLQAQVCMLVERVALSAHELASITYSAFQVVTSLPCYRHNCLQRDPWI